MKKARIWITFDTHTPYLAFRVRVLQRALVEQGVADQVALEVVLIAGTEASYGWEAGRFAEEYGGVPVRVLTEQFRGLGIKTYFKPTTWKTTLKMAWYFLKRRPKLVFVGGYDRLESLTLGALSVFTRAKIGPLHDSRFNDAESFAKRIGLEWVKSLMMRWYDFFMCSGRECAEYSRFLAGPKKPTFTAAWDIVDNAEIARLADDSARDASILARLGLNPEDQWFFMPIRFIPKKNASVVIDAYASYAENTPNPAKLIICGQGPLEKEYLAQIEQLKLGDLVKILPWLPYADVPRAARMSLAVLLASTHDQWGMTINEALAAGSPVLCSSRAGAHEVVQNFVNGFTFHPWQPEHLTELFRALAESPDLVRRLREKARRSVETFSERQWLEACFGAMNLAGIKFEVAPETRSAQTSPRPHVAAVH